MNNDYWKKRIRAEQEAKIERDANLGEEMKRLYDYHFSEIEKEIRAFEQRYADKNGLTLKDVRERVSDMDVQAFEEKAKRYVAEKDFSAKANSELALYNLKMRMKRLELLQYQMDLELVTLADSEHKMTEKFLNQEYAKELELQAGLLGGAVLSDGAIKQMAQATLNTPFKGVTWSSRIWERQDELRHIVAKMTEDLLLKGKNPTEMIPRLRREFGVSASEARRLAVTEGARVATEAQKQAFDANGYTEYEFISEPKACEICKPLDGKIFKVAKMTPGENASPMHPHCRCSTAAHYSLSDEEYKRILKESWESVYGSKKLGRMSNKLYNDNMSDVKNSGAISERRGDIKKQQDEFAERYYSQLKNSNRENIISKMVSSSLLPKETVAIALKHVLDDQYLLWDSEEYEYRVRNFYPHYDMAQSLQRLYLGNPLKSDIMMLQHESLESEYMSKYNLPYDEAHRLANQQYNYEEADKHGENR